jgi:hypothetical protein
LNVFGFLPHALIGVAISISGFVSWLVWFDTTCWGKSLDQILCGSRVNEAMSLGVGLIAMDYVVISLTMLVLGLLTLTKQKLKLTNATGAVHTNVQVQLAIAEAQTPISRALAVVQTSQPTQPVQRCVQSDEEEWWFDIWPSPNY